MADFTQTLVAAQRAGTYPLFRPVFLLSTESFSSTGVIVLVLLLRPFSPNLSYLT